MFQDALSQVYSCRHFRYQIYFASLSVQYFYLLVQEELIQKQVEGNLQPVQNMVQVMNLPAIEKVFIHWISSLKHIICVC